MGIQQGAIARAPAVECLRRGLASVPPFTGISLKEEVAPIRVISVGRLIEKKGFFKQLEIYKHWHAQGIAFEAEIVGEGPIRRQLEDAISRLGLGDKVHLVGKLDYQSVVELYQKSSLFLFTGLVSSSGDRDGFPNVIGEAMAYSLPVFSTDVSGTAEGVLDGDRGTIIDTEDPEKASTRILEVLQDMNRLEAMTRAAHEWILSEFQVSSNVSKLRRMLWGSSWHI